MKSKRKVADVKTFADKKTGEPVEVDYGGAPNVLDLTQGRENKRMWDFEADGPLGNGTKARVEFEVYAKGAGVRLLNIAVTEHVPYDNNSAISEADELFAF